MNIEVLVRQHKNWKNLVESLFNKEGSSLLNPGALSKADECDLGHWLKSKEASSFLFDDNFDKLKELHSDFHYLAGKIIFEFQAGKVNEAEKLIPKFSKVSDKLIMMLGKLKD